MFWALHLEPLNLAIPWQEGDKGILVAQIHRRFQTNYDFEVHVDSRRTMVTLPQNVLAFRRPSFLATTYQKQQPESGCFGHRTLSQSALKCPQTFRSRYPSHPKDMNRHLSAQYPNSHASQAGPRRARVSEELLIVADQIAEAVEESRRQEAILRSSAPRQQHPSQGQMIPSQSLLEPQVSAERVAEDVEELRRRAATNRSSTSQQHPPQRQIIMPHSLHALAPFRDVEALASQILIDPQKIHFAS
ncbi:hypothetical protein WG66_016883 [Moniliophthora roreri]|nr:hypothetical protein WG66_016883 [Moniliophthora roreri]